MPFMLFPFSRSIPPELLFFVFLFFDRINPESVDDYVNDGRDNDRVEGSTDIKGNKDITQILLEPVDCHFDRPYAFSAQNEIAGEILHIVHRRHCDRIAQPDHRNGDRHIELDKGCGRQYGQHLHRHRNESPEEAYQYSFGDRFSIDRKIFSGDLVLIDKSIDFSGTLFVFFENFSYH